MTTTVSPVIFFCQVTDQPSIYI